MTRPEDYTRENVSGSKSRLVGSINDLNFALDEEAGVSNTFDVPYFEYQTLLTHNIYSNRNQKSVIQFDNGNTSKLVNSNLVVSKWNNPEIRIWFSKYLEFLFHSLKLNKNLQKL